jgi:hypothetical protein
MHYNDSGNADGAQKQSERESREKMLRSQRSRQAGSDFYKKPKTGRRKLLSTERIKESPLLETATIQRVVKKQPMFVDVVT